MLGPAGSPTVYLQANRRVMSSEAIGCHPLPLERCATRRAPLLMQLSGREAVARRRCEASLPGRE